MQSFPLSIITPEKTLFSGQATQVTVPGTCGEFGVLAGHEPFISTLREGEILVDGADGKHFRIAVESGIAEVVPEHCTILAEKTELLG